MEAPHNQNDLPLTERQKRRRFEKTIVTKGFQGAVIIDSNPHEACRQAQLEYVNASHWGDEKSRMVFWTKGCTGTTDNIEFDKISGLGIISQTSPDPEQWIWSAYHVMRDIDNATAEILAVAMALQIAKGKCGELEVGERPGKVVVYSCSRDALLRMQQWSDNTTSARGKMIKAAARVVEVGLVAAHSLNERGIEVELRWIPNACDTDGVLEAVYAASEGVKHKPAPRGPDAFIKDIQAEYKRKRERRRRREARRRKKAEERKLKRG